MNRTLELVLAGLLVLIVGLATLARRFPHIGWLHAFRRAFPQPSASQRATMRRRADFHAGIQLILMGLVLPLGYVALTVMFFNDFTRTGIALVAAASLALIVLGGLAIRHSRRTGREE